MHDHSTIAEFAEEPFDDLDEEAESEKELESQRIQDHIRELLDLAEDAVLNAYTQIEGEADETHVAIEIDEEMLDRLEAIEAHTDGLRQLLITLSY